MTTAQIDQEFDNIALVRTKLIDPVKLQLHTGLEGFDSPDSYGIYRKTGGQPLGVVGRIYEPPNLHHILDSFVKSASDCCNDNVNLSELKYTEYKGGSKVSIDLPSRVFEVKSKVIGDVFQTKLHLFTGFDGLTKTSLSFSILRLTCLNGAKSWNTELELNFKNTPGNAGKIEYFGDKILEIQYGIDNYRELLNKLAQKQVTQSQINTFMKKVFGYDQSEYNELTTRRRNTLDRINESVAIEQNELGANAYALLQGITHYTSHVLSDSVEDTFFGTAATINRNAHVAASALLN